MSQNICAMCNGSGKTPNFQKLIDPPIKKYGTMLEHRPQRSEFPRKACEPVKAMVVPCPPTPIVQGASSCSKGRSTLIQVPCDPPAPCPRFVCEPCPPPPPIKVWLIRSSPMPQKSFCLPMGGGCNAPSSSGNSIGVPILIAFPGQPIYPIQKDTPRKEKEKLKPVGRITRNKDMDFIAGKIVSKCTCGMRNGLNGDGCPRLSCQNNPGCGMFPPQCWPQFKEPEEPEPIPDQEMICVPIEFVYGNAPKF